MEFGCYEAEIVIQYTYEEGNRGRVVTRRATVEQYTAEVLASD